MSDVEFDNQDDGLDIPKRTAAPINSVLAKTIVTKKFLPDGTKANYLLIGISIVCMIISLIFFSLFLQEGEDSTRTMQQLQKQKSEITR